MPVPVAYAVVGTGWITDSWIDAASKSGQWQLTAVYSRSKEQAEAFGQKHGCSNTHTTLESLGDDSSISTVYIASPNSLHYSHAKQMLEAGKNVILEKPATSTLAELEDLFALAQTKGLVLIEAFRHIQEANYKALRRAIGEERRLGPIYGASFTYASYSSRYDNVLAGETPNIFSLDFSGGSLVDIGVYPIAFAVGLFGRPQSQTYVPFICRTGVDGGGLVVLRYDGFGVQINNSKAYTSTAPCEVYGQKGTISTNATSDLKTLAHWDPKTKETTDFAGPCVEVQKPFVNMLEEAAEFARIIGEKDTRAALELEEISKIVLGVTQDLRRQNGILYPADK